MGSVRSKTNQKTLGQHYPSIPLCSLPSALLNFEQNSTQQNIFTAGFGFKIANRWLSGYFDLNIVWLSGYSVSSQKIQYFCP